MQRFRLSNSKLNGYDLTGEKSIITSVNGLQFQILQRQSNLKFQDINAIFNKGQVDEGWHDTVLVKTDETVKILMKFKGSMKVYISIIVIIWSMRIWARCAITALLLD